jgi:dephospho-CoA kinase/dTDP-4-dehydrorhamnose 3,5-epimerase-like enzyme
MMVLGLAGYTKSRKSTLARYLVNVANFELIEMSDPIRENIKQEKGSISNVYELIKRLEDFRAKYGENILAKIALEKIQSSKNTNFAIAGVRSFDDHMFFKQNIEGYYSIFLHTSPEKRHQRLLNDPTSIAKNKEDFEFLDIQCNNQGIINLANDVDYTIVNDDGFPLTFYEQMENILLAIKNKHAFPITIKDFNNNIITKKSNKMKEKGYQVKKLPVYKDRIPENGELISRVIKDRGELTNISISTANHVAYVEFPIDGVPRANHYHEEKQEYLYLIKGKVKLFIRRGGRPEETVEEILIDEGSLVFIEPGWAHAYVTIEEGFAVEFSPTPYEIIRKDKVVDFIIKK